MARTKNQSTADAYTTIVAGLSVPLWPEVAVALTPPLDLTPDAYAEQRVVLPRALGERAGRLSFDLTPWQREPLREMGNPANQSVVVCAVPQIGKTTMLSALVGWVVECQPCQFLYTLPEWSDVTYTLQERLSPMVEATESLSRLLASPITSRKARFRNGALLVSASGRSANSLRGKPIALAISDEVSAWPLVSKASEGANPLDLVENRMRGQRRRMHVMVSTPVLADDPFDLAWQESDRREFFVPCRRCNWWHVLDDTNLRWIEGTPRKKLRTDGDVHLVCPACSERISDEDRVPMMRAGVWVPAEDTINGKTGVVTPAGPPSDQKGYHLSALYSPTQTLADFAVARVRAVQQPERYRQVLENFWRGRAFARTAAGGSADPASRQLEYERGTVPECFLLLTAGVDVQVDHLVWVVRAWSWDEQSWLVDYGTADGWDALDRVLFGSEWKVGPVPNQDAEDRGNRAAAPRVIRCGVDMSDGNRTDEVYAYATERRGFVIAMKGNADCTPPVQLRRLTKSKVKGHVGQQYALWSHEFFFSKIVAGMRAKEGRRGAWWTFATDDDYQQQMSSTRRVLRKAANGTIEEVWERKDPNHFFDAEAMAWVAAERAGIARFMRRGVAGVSGGRAEELRRNKSTAGSDQSGGRPRGRR